MKFKDYREVHPCIRFSELDLGATVFYEHKPYIKIADTPDFKGRAARTVNAVCLSDGSSIHINSEYCFSARDIVASMIVKAADYHAVLKPFGDLSAGDLIILGSSEYALVLRDSINWQAESFSSAVTYNAICLSDFTAYSFDYTLKSFDPEKEVYLCCPDATLAIYNAGIAMKK